MNTATSIATEISGEQAGGNRVLGIRNNRKCNRGQHGLDQAEIVLAKAIWAIGRERKADPAVWKRLGHHANRDQFGDIISRPRVRQLLEKWKVALRLASGQPTPQAQRQVSPSGNIAQIGIGAVPYIPLIDFAAFAPGWVDLVTVAPPGVGVTGPLRMLGSHPGKSAPNRHTSSN